MVGRVEGPKERVDMWHVYIIRCADDTLYTGVTTDVSRRVKRHNSKKASKYTRVRTPVALIYQEPAFSKTDALRREIQIKNWSKQKKLALINGNKSLLRNLSKSRD